MKTNFLNIGYKIESSNKTQEKTTGVEHYLFFAHPHGLACGLAAFISLFSIGQPTPAEPAMLPPAARRPGASVSVETTSSWLVLWFRQDKVQVCCRV